jgi:NFU1 iron-sulfur cluster scaffold homolog, mitochondrial
MQEIVNIRSEVDPRNPDVCRFTSERTLHIGTRTVRNMNDAEGIPLAQELMRLPDIRRLQLIGHLLVVTKTPQSDWAKITREVEEILAAFLVSALALKPEDVLDQMMIVGRSTREKVQYLVDTQINPGVAAHGGAVQVIDVTDGVLYLQLHGGCQGCGAADFTLKQGIEQIVRKAVPEIQSIVDVTNHSAGLSPYYKRDGETS